jgi:hypothetical protein
VPQEDNSELHCELSIIDERQFSQNLIEFGK